MNQRVKVQEVFDPELYNHMQVFLLKIYLDECRVNGDSRDKNEILTEWIKLHSEEFRKNWCEHQHHC